MKELDKYSSFIFDCDGVVLNSNKIKSDAFYEVAIKYNKKSANQLVAYHTKNGGISRYKKFEYFVDNILFDRKNNNINKLCEEFASIVQRELKKSEVNNEIFDLKKKYPNIPWMIVSGGDQEELRKVFKYKKIDDLFNGGIFGSPMDKVSIFKSLSDQDNMPAIYFGDSKYDYLSSKECGFDFCFVSKWTEVKDWENYCNEYNIHNIHNFSSLI